MVWMLYIGIEPVCHEITSVTTLDDEVKPPVVLGKKF